MMFVKVCGITRLEDAVAAAEAGASAVGFVFWPGSPRWITAGRAAAIAARVPAQVRRVGVFVNQPPAEMQAIAEEVRLDVVQLHGDETPDRIGWWRGEVWRAASLEEIEGTLALWPATTTVILDAGDRETRGGTGRTIAWEQAAAVARRRRTVLAGGLTPENVAAAIEIVQPWGVDVSSGVEDAPGVKTAAQVRQFVAAARTAGPSSRRK